MMRSLAQTMLNALLSADADAVVGAEYGQPSPAPDGWCNATTTATAASTARTWWTMGVARDGNLVTSRSPDDFRAFCSAIPVLFSQADQPTGAGDRS